MIGVFRYYFGPLNKKFQSTSVVPVDVDWTARW